MGNYGSRMSSFFTNDYTDEERRGVEKYLWRRFVYGGIATVILLVFALSIPLCKGINFACVRSDCIGTWILAEDYYDGFDSDDCYIDFREEKNNYDESVLILYKNGSKIGRVLTKAGGQSAVQRERLLFFYNYGNDDLIYLSFDKDELTMEYTEYPAHFGSVIINSNISPSDYHYPYTAPFLSGPEEMTEKYIRISEDYKLTEEQRAALY